MNAGVSTAECELKHLFEVHVGERSYLEHRWEDYAGWTLPILFPHEEYYSTTEMQHDYNSLGAQCVNHLSNKIVVTLFPPARPFFKVELTPEQTQMVLDQGFTEGDVDIFTSRAEKQAMKNAQLFKLRTAMILGMKNLIALGNTLVYMPQKDAEVVQIYNMRDYVVKRDPSGNVLQIITRDKRTVDTIPEQFQAAAEKARGSVDDDKVDLFTGITLTDNDSFFVKQEIGSEVVSTTGQYSKEDLPWHALTWNLTRGADYGNGLVEEYAGDFHVISSLSESNLNLAAIASDIKILVNPMGQTDVDTLNNSAPGTYVYGSPNDIAYLQLEKLNELQFSMNMLDTYERRISAAFLLNSQVTRDAERVTAEEIRMNINELEGSLGGVYSRLGEDLQARLAKQLIASVNQRLASLDPVILTGVESLSRNAEHEQIVLFLNDLAILQAVPEPLIPFLKFDDIAKVLASNRGLEYTKFVKTSEEVEEDMEEAQEQQTEAAMNEAIADGLGQQIGMTAI